MLSKWVMTLPWNLIEKHATTYNLDPKLIGSIIMTESSGNPAATRFETKWKYFLTPDIFAKQLGITVDTENVLQATSWGLMQIMGSVAREMGYRDHLPKLISPATNLDVGCRFVAKLMSRMSGNFSDVVASFNAGSPRKTPEGSYVNQVYVDKVLGYFREIA